MNVFETSHLAAKSLCVFASIRSIVKLIVQEMSQQIYVQIEFIRKEITIWHGKKPFN
jgi:hypothetical protein